MSRTDPPAQDRARAAASHRAGPRSQDEEVTRVWWARDPADLRARLGADALAVWAEDDVLQVLWRGPAERVFLGGGVQPELWPVRGGAGELWEASLRIRRLPEAVISVFVFAVPPGGSLDELAASEHALWRGPQAPAGTSDAGLTFMSPEIRLDGALEFHTIDSAALGAARGVTVYRPPGETGRIPACLLADGESVPGFAGVLETAILAGAAPAVMLVGVHSARDRGRAELDGRAREYLPGQDRARFGAHLRFVTDEVIPWTLERHPSPRTWLSAGCSNGAAWAIGAAQRRPDLFVGVAALSSGMVPARIARAARSARVRHFLASGTLEEGFRRASRQWADRLAAADLPFRHVEWVGGHDPFWWQRHLPEALGWLLRPADQAEERR